GSWTRFLQEDAATTRKAFVAWVSENYLQSVEGRMLSKSTKREIAALSDPRAFGTITRESLSPETVTVVETWENIPLIPNSPEWRTARIRLMRDLLVDGTLIKHQSQGLQFDPQEVAQARVWIFERPDGFLAKYESLSQPWCYKSFAIRDGNLVPTLVSGTLDLASLPKPVVDEHFNTDRIRISRSILKDVIRGKRTPESALSAALFKSSIEDHDFVAETGTMDEGAAADAIQQLLAAIDLDGSEVEGDVD
ncbi:MAG: hypothetical protein Q9204_005222, partial [Flavoplaca sp. TL-2023a]